MSVDDPRMFEAQQVFLQLFPDFPVYLKMLGLDILPMKRVAQLLQKAYDESGSIKAYSRRYGRARDHLSQMIRGKRAQNEQLQEMREEDVFNSMVHFLNTGNLEAKKKYFELKAFSCMHGYDATFKELKNFEKTYASKTTPYYHLMLSEGRKFLESFKKHLILLVKIPSVPIVLKTVPNSATSPVVNNIPEVRNALKKVQPMKNKKVKKQKKSTTTASSSTSSVPAIEIFEKFQRQNVMKNLMFWESKKIKSEAEMGGILCWLRKETDAVYKRLSVGTQTNQPLLEQGDLRVDLTLLYQWQIFATKNREYTANCCEKAAESMKLWMEIEEMECCWLGQMLKGEKVTADGAPAIPEDHYPVRAGNVEFANLVYQRDNALFLAIKDYTRHLFPDYFNDKPDFPELRAALDATEEGRELQAKNDEYLRDGLALLDIQENPETPENSSDEDQPENRPGCSTEDSNDEP